jgi:hypothetical protein
MRMSHPATAVRPEAYRPSPAVLRRVHGLRRQRGKLAAIEPRSGDYFLADDLLTAVHLGREKYPGAIFYVIRIGYPAAHVHHGGPRRVRR